jgi:hypothetical protein
MARFKNGFGEDRIVPTLGFRKVRDGAELTVPDEEWEHWQAGGWVPLTPDPRVAAEPEPVPVARPVPAAAVPAPVVVESEEAK